MKIDYRTQHQSEEVSRVYDEVVYCAGSYNDVSWQEEKIKKRQMKICRDEAAYLLA